MTNKRNKKNPQDDTQTEFDLPIEGSVPPQSDAPEVEVNLPEETATSLEPGHDGAIDCTDTSPDAPLQIGESFPDAPDTSTDADADAEELAALTPEDPDATDTAPFADTDRDVTKTAPGPDATSTEHGQPKALDEHGTRDFVDRDPTLTAMGQTKDKDWPDALTVDLSDPATESLQDPKFHNDVTIDFDDDEPPTGDFLPPTGTGAPRFEAVHIEVPADTFVDTYFERRDEEEGETRGVTTTRRGWRDRLEKAEPSPWRDFALWTAQRLDPRPVWQKLKQKRRRRTGEEPKTSEIAKDAARAIGQWAVKTVRPRAEIAAVHNGAWWRRTFMEIAALFLMVVPVEFTLTGDIGSFGTHPHPYWLIVIPLACARGVVAGLLAAGLASILFAVGALDALNAIQSTSVGEIFEFEYMLEPILFFVVAFFCGELHDEIASRYKKLERRLDDVQTRNQSMRQERDVLRDANRELERRIVDASVQFGNLVISAERIEQSGRTEVFEIALELIEEHCGATSSVLLRLEDGSLDYLSHRGWSHDEMADRLTSARQSELVTKAVSEGRVINGFGGDEEAPSDGPLVAAPLFDENGVVKALLCLDDIPATRLNESTIRTFLGIARWISAALTRVTRSAALESRGRIEQPITVSSLMLGNAEDLGERLRMELERCARYGVPTTFLAVHLTDWSDPTAEGMEAADRFVATHFTTGLRPSDNIYRFGYPGCYVLVLAGTGMSGAEVVRARLLRRVDYAAKQLVGPVNIFATGPDADAPDLISLIERVAKRFRIQSELPLDGACPIAVPERTEAGTRASFLRRLKLETSLASRRDDALHVVAVRSSREVETLARHLNEVGGRLLRATDGIYAVEPGCAAIVMPSTGGEEAALLGNRMIQALRDRDPGAIYGDVDIHVIEFGVDHPDVHGILRAIGVTPALEEIE